MCWRSLVRFLNVGSLSCFLSRAGEILSPRTAIASCVLLAAVSAGAPSSFAQGIQSGDQTKDQSTVRGTVINAVTHEPIGRALVSSPGGQGRAIRSCGQAPDGTADDTRCRSASSMLTLSTTSVASTTSDTVPTQ